MEMRAAGLVQGGFPVAARPGVASARLHLVTLGAFLLKDQGACRLSTEPPETSENPLPPGFPEAEFLVTRDTAGEHTSG